MSSTLHVQLRKRHSSGRFSRFELETTFTAAPGVTMIVGHSGAGKTTILRCIAGLCDPEEGRIAVGDRVLFDSRQRIKLEPARRRVAFVFQDLALFPHLSVQDNVMYGLRRLERSERERRMHEILESFQISHLCGRSPREISGGEQQRVALARSLVTEPSVLLLDEPLSSLDPRTKVRIVEDLQKWNRTRGIPILYVTHDHGEVFAMGDRVVALEQGRIVAEGLPLDVVPASSRAAPAQPGDFENFFDATVIELREQEDTMVCQITGTSVFLKAPLAQVSIGSEVCLGARAGEILVSASPPAIVSDCNVIPGRIRQLDRLGSVVEARVGCGAEFRVRMDARSAQSRGLGVASEVWMMIGTHACHLVRPVLLDSLRRLFVFVCHGNTVRSPMAQAICNAEIAGRFGVPLESLDRLGIKAVSAGLSARPGEPIAAEVEQALGRIGMPVPEHRSRNLTHRLAQRAEAIFCMTEEQRRELTALFPAAQPKSYRLHPDEDVGDPHGKTLDGFLDCALQIQDLVRQRLDGFGVCSAE
ncbi:MAG TPA: ATP-binding cassette domain-containing protein [Thermoanaerobaculia bacterium]|jgi:molybdate transport system ATP-binding protein|nr:ATP-binding cassette domain-containing protein [Thermoanaerobaculia bacterium]